MRADAIRNELERRAPDMPAEVLDIISEMAAIADEVIQEERWRSWTVDDALAFSGMTDRLLRGLYFAGTKRIAETRAERIAGEAIRLTDRLLAVMPPAGRA